MFHMNRQMSEIWQHTPSEIQVTKEPVKAVPNLLLESKITWNDLLGLPWSLEEELQ